jgi:transposase
MTYYIGMDVHKKYTHCTVMETTGNVLRSHRLDNDKDKLINFLSLYTQPKVCFEAVGNWYWLSDLLNDQGIKHIMAHPLKLKAIASAKIKNDKIDSKILAHLLRTNLIPKAYMADSDNRALRDLLRTRIGFVRLRTKLKNNIHAVLAKYNFICPYTDLFGKKGRQWLASLDLRLEYQDIINRNLVLIDQLDIQIKELDLQATKIVKLSKDSQLLLSVPGIGPLSAALLTTEIGPIDRFPTAQQFASFTGLVPSTYSSGGKTRQGKITKQGNSYVRWTLVESTARLCRLDPWFKARYQRLKLKKGSAKARVAMARKLAVIIYKMLSCQRSFESRPVRRQA